MTTSLKDVSSAEMIRTLAEMNCFEQECALYGYAWQMPNGKRMYSMSEDELFIQQEFEQHLTSKYCMTPVQQWSTRAIIKEETMEDLMLYFKLQLAKQLKDHFNAAYFSQLSVLQQVPSDNQADTLLSQWQEEIEGYFDEDAVLLFEGAVNYAYVTKHLQEWRYKQLEKWIQHVKKQISGKMRVHDNCERTFYGVAYQNDTAQTFSFLLNANEKTLYNHVKSFDQQGIFHTPVYQKTYWYSRSNELAKVRALFDADLKRTMDEAYLERMLTLQNLPSAIPKEIWDTCLQNVEKECSPEAVAGLQYWGRRWNVPF